MARIVEYTSCCVAVILADMPGAHGVMGTVDSFDRELSNKFANGAWINYAVFATINHSQKKMGIGKVLMKHGFNPVRNFGPKNNKERCTVYLRNFMV